MGYISIDVEASGPLPPDYDLLSIGAVVLERRDGDLVLGDDEGFYVELKPRSGREDPGAMAVHGLDPAKLRAEGSSPEEAARSLDAWVRKVSTEDDPPIFVGYCANFDWTYVNELFHHAGIENPFGYKALDIRSLAHGVFQDLAWEELRQDVLLPRLDLAPLSDDDAHHALADARHQAFMLRELLRRRQSRGA
ncbi:MAG: 3'-5' exoribonuclease domain-containing protein [Planctomycetota bacterium JB042]